MLESLYIENFAIINQVQIDFHSGMTVLTGETGAGKSLIINALNIISGGRFLKEMIRNGEYKPYTDAISPAAYVNADTVPTILGYGVRDGAVPPSLKYILIDALEQNGVPYEYIEFSNSGHGLLNDPDKTQEYIDTVNEYLDLYFENK